MASGEPDPGNELVRSPVETLAVRSPDGVVVDAVCRRPPGVEAPPLVAMLHGGLDPLPEAILAAIAARSLTARRLLAAGFAVVVPTRRARPDGARPSGAIADTVAALAAARERLGEGPLVLFGSSGGGDLAFEMAGTSEYRQRLVALMVEEPATSLLTGILDVDTPRRGATWSPDEVWPIDYARHYTAARREATRRVLAGITSPILVLEGDQPVGDADPRRPLDAVLIPELEALGHTVTRRRYPGQTHGFGLLTGVGPEPVTAETAAATARLGDDVLGFIARARPAR